MSLFKLFSLILIIGLSEKSLAQGHKYVLNGEHTSAVEGTKIFLTLTKFIPDGQPIIRELEVRNGKFSISGTLKEPFQAAISWSKSITPGSDVRYFILDKGVQKLTITSNLQTASMEGSKAQSDIDRYTLGITPISRNLQLLNEEAGKLQSGGLSQDSIWKKYRHQVRLGHSQAAAYQKKYILENSDSFISLLLIPEIARYTLNFIQADSLFNHLDGGTRSTPTAFVLSKYIQDQIPLSIGAFAPDFSLPDTSGKQVSLKSFQGQYVLLDFWAAWCGPCREENPNLVNAYLRYKDQGFTVFGISLDRERKAWLQAVEKDRLIWTNVSDLKYWASAPAIQYKVSSIPKNFLLDREGRIIGRDLRGTDLLEKLQELFPD